MPVFAISPGVYAQERDLSVRVNPTSTSIAAIVFASKKGSTDLTFNSSREGFISEYGEPDLSVGYGHHSALAFLTEGRNLWGKRVVNGALYGYQTYVSDREGALHTTNTPIAATIGSPNNFEDGGSEVQAIVFGADFITGNNMSVELVIVGAIGTNVINADKIATVPFATSHNDTITALANAIKSALAEVTTGFRVSVVPGSPTNRIIRIFSPLNIKLSIVDVAVTGGASQATAVVEDLKLFDVFAINPGAWNKTIGTRIADIDVGVPQRLKLTFDRALVTGNSVAVTLNGTTLAAVPFATSNDVTLANVATAIQTALGATSEVYVDQIGGSASNDREIILVAPDAYADVIVNTVIVSGGATQAEVTVQETLTRTAPDNTFLFEVYSTDNIAKALESFTVSMGRQLDGYGAQQNIAEVINKGPKASSYIRIYQPEWSLDVKLKNTHLSPSLLVGGADGSAVRTSDLMAGWESMRYRETVDIRMMINAGYAVPAVQKKMTEIAEYRRDCFAILDMPSDQQKPAQAVYYRKFTMNINSNYAGIYTPDLEIQDQYTNRVLYIPPSGYMAGVYAKTDRVSATWFAPAGLNRADLSSKILGLRHYYTLGDRDLMFPANINFIIRMPGKGFPVWAAETLQSKSSALSNINVRRLLIFTEVSIVDTLDYSVFEPGDPFTRSMIVDQITQFVEPIKNGRGIKEYMVVSDERNNSPNDEDEGVLNVEFLVKPRIPSKFIRLLSTITRSSANFEELIATS